MFLELGGRLVYWLPIMDEVDGAQLIMDPPEHPCLSIVSSPSQQFGNWKRVLVTMEKIKEPMTENDLNQDDRQFESFRKHYFKLEE